MGVGETSGAPRAVSQDLSDILLHTPETRIDGPDDRDHIYQIGEAGARMSIEELVALPGLREYRKPPEEWPDQGQTGACTCFAGEHWLWSLRRRIFGRDTITHLSAMGAYNAYRSARGRLGYDEGMTVRDYMRGTREIGLWDRNLWNPFSGGQHYGACNLYTVHG